MKRLILPILLWILFTEAGYAQITKIGAGIAAGTGIYFNNTTDNSNSKSGLPAVFVTGVYEFSIPVHLSPSFTYYFPHLSRFSIAGESTRQVISCMMFDLNGHYVFSSLNRFRFYGLTGINITLIGNKLVSDIGGTTVKRKESDNALGLNIGAGTCITLREKLDFSLEAKYILSKYDQFLFNAGILIQVDWFSRREKTGLRATGLSQ